MKNKSTTALVILAILVIAGPFINIWALNTLFPALAIPYTFWTWLATIIVVGNIKAKPLV